VLPGQRAVVFANNDDAAMTISHLADAGITVLALIDSRAMVPQPITDLAARLGTPVYAGAVVRRARGKQSVTSVEIITANGAIVEIPCDLLAMSGGWSPAVHLTSHLDGKPVWNDDVTGFVPGTLPPGMAVAGAASGAFSLADALHTGAAAGGDAAASCGFAATPFVIPTLEFESTSITPLWQIPASTQKRGSQGKVFVDFQNDVTVNDVALAKQEGFRAVEHLKRYTTLGMATDQGKTANVNGLAVMAGLTGTTIAETGTTRFRPPYTPIAIGALAGHHRSKDFRPTRLPPTHQWATEQGAVFVETGLWLRAQYFPRAGEADWLTTVCREVAAVRSGVGFCDVTTLGKIDIQGADAAKFLDCVYTNSWAALPVGRVRYGLMLREDGFVKDDGTTARLAADRFVMTTTTANAGAIFQHLEFCHQWLWPELDVHLISVTDQWAQISIAGPRSRDTLRKLIDPGFDISNEAFPAMQAGEITVQGGIRARLFRLSFSGELAYEIAVPARHGDNLARWLMQAGAEFGITPYGLEALGVMRIEKGHPAGSELNGTTTAHDLGMAKLLSKKKDFIGRAMAARPALTDPGRQRLIGLRPVDRTVRLRAGAHLLAKDAPLDAAHDEGYITSVAYSPTLSHWIGLGLLANGPSRLGEIVRVFDPVRNGDALAEVVSPIFYDPTGERANG
jgi:glycine cleavage system aminomethyltransferase T